MAKPTVLIKATERLEKQNRFRDGICAYVQTRKQNKPEPLAACCYRRMRTDSSGGDDDSDRP